MSYGSHFGNPVQDVWYKLILVGDSSVGKTSLLLRYVDETFTSDYTSTIEVDFKVKTVNVGDTTVRQKFGVMQGRSVLVIKPTSNLAFIAEHMWLFSYSIRQVETHSIILSNGWVILIGMLLLL